MKSKQMSWAVKCGLVLQVMAMGMYGCGKKESDEAPAATSATSGGGVPGVVAEEGNDVTLTGQLALGDLSLAGAEQGILAFTMVKGELKSAPTKIEVDAEGKFSVPIAKVDAALDYLLEQMELDPADRDYETMATVVNESGIAGRDLTAEFLQEMPEEDLQEGIAGAAQDNKDGGNMTLLVAYDISEDGDVIAEAESFRFINLPTPAGKGLSAIPNRDLKGSVSFGQITGDGTDVISEVDADEALDLSESVLETLADASRALKTVKNEYMNSAWGVTPFYFWKSNVAKEDVIDAFSNISLNTYHGYGAYVPTLYGTTPDVTFEELCGDKLVTITPPTAVNIKDFNDALTSVDSFDNVDSTIQNQGGSRSCYSAAGMYIREDVRDGETSFMSNFGTGGSIQDSPAGLWRMEIGSVEVARFDMALAKPVDADNNPLVLLPSAKFISSGGNITGVEIKLYSWNGSEYVQLTDMEPVIKLVSEMSASVTKTSDNGESMARMVIGDDGVLTGVFDGTDEDRGEVRNPAVATNDITAFAFYYVIGNASYRMEFR